MRKNCSNDREKLLQFEAEGQEFAKFLRSLGQFIQTVKGHSNLLNQFIPESFIDKLEQLEFRLEKNIGI